MEPSQIIKEKNLMEIICRSLNLVDARLVDHGRHVAYILHKMLVCEGGYSKKQLDDILMLSLLHDIGAYKTEEIDDLFRFENDNVWQHAIYGYIFIKNFSPLSELADVILYHHTPCHEIQRLQTPLHGLALRLFFTDRLDILIHSRSKITPESFLSCRDTRFPGKDIDLFFRAQEQFQIIENLQSGAYRQEMAALELRLHFTDNEIECYLKMLVFLIDFRSEVTVTHTLMTTALSEVIAELMGASPPLVHSICMGAMLHDLGKIATPVSILEAPGRLSPEQMKVMREHVSITADILQNLIDPQVFRIAVRHHEKLDGTGYPLGLTGGELTTPERIVAVADIISALQGRRSYKEALDKDEVVSIISAMSRSGKLDAHIISLVLEHYDKISAAAQRKCRAAVDAYHLLSQEYRQLYTQFCIETGKCAVPLQPLNNII